MLVTWLLMKLFCGKTLVVHPCGMNRTFSFLLLVGLLLALGWLLHHFTKPGQPAIQPPKKIPPAIQKAAYLKELRSKAGAAKLYSEKKGFCTRYAFLVDMGLPSGRNRFFIYDLQKNSVLYTGLVAHGSCNTQFLETARFSNQPGCGCSSLGHYKVGEAYTGRFGEAFKLYGLDSTNSHAYERAVVLHGYSSVPDAEPYPMPIGNSLGCPMVSYKLLEKAKGVIGQEKKPVLLWVYK